MTFMNAPRGLGARRGPLSTRLLGTVTLVLVTGTLVAGCADREKRVMFEGNHYPAKARAESRDDRRGFTATVRRADAGLDGARAAARHEGITYCVRNFGTSDIAWAVGPEADPDVLMHSSGAVTVSGRCAIWQ